MHEVIGSIYPSFTFAQQQSSIQIQSSPLQYKADIDRPIFFLSDSGSILEKSIFDFSNKSGKALSMISDEIIEAIRQQEGR